MKKNLLKNFKNIYFIGIKGTGMTPIAQILKFQKYNISGSDIKEEFFTDKVLKRAKIKFFNGFNKKNIPQDVDLVIHSSAFREDNNIEMKEVVKRKIPILTQAEALAEIFNSYQKGIAVCGSHGKTTTSALLGFVLNQVGLKPTVEVGSSVPQFKGNAIVGSSDYMTIEADEYQNKLKLYNPWAVLLNNIDYDHPDYFKTKASYQKVFVDFVKRIPKNGFVVANFDDEQVVKAVKNCKCKIIKYGQSGNFKCQNLGIKKGFQYFKIKNSGEFKMQLVGEHNVQNATAVIATCLELKISLTKIKPALTKFKGTARRMEKLGKFNNALFIDDYGHHPVEVKTTLKAVRDLYPDKNVICAFMPHMFTRTKALLNDFGKSFDSADEVLILPTYASARENKTYEISKDLVKKINTNCHSGLVPVRLGWEAKTRNPEKIVKYIPSIKNCAQYFKKNIGKEDVVVLMGAGDTFRVWDYLKK